MKEATGASIRAIVFDGNRSFSSSQWSVMKAQTRAAWRRLASARPTTKGASWVLMSPLRQRSSVRSTSASTRKSARQ